MGRYVTPAGVVIEMSPKAALAVGYQQEVVVQVTPFLAENPPAVRRRPGRPKKSE